MSLHLLKKHEWSLKWMTIAGGLYNSACSIVKSNLRQRPPSYWSNCPDELMSNLGWERPLWRDQPFARDLLLGAAIVMKIKCKTGEMASYERLEWSQWLHLLQKTGFLVTFRVVFITGFTVSSKRLVAQNRFFHTSLHDWYFVVRERTSPQFPARLSTEIKACIFWTLLPCTLDMLVWPWNTCGTYYSSQSIAATIFPVCTLLATYYWYEGTFHRVFSSHTCTSLSLWLMKIEKCFGCWCWEEEKCCPGIQHWPAGPVAGLWPVSQHAITSSHYLATRYSMHLTHTHPPSPPNPLHPHPPQTVHLVPKHMAHWGCLH